MELSRQIAAALLESDYARRLVSLGLLRAQIKKTLKNELEKLRYTGLMVQTGPERFGDETHTQYDLVIYLQPAPWDIKGLEKWAISSQIEKDIRKALETLVRLNIGIEYPASWAPRWGNPPGNPIVVNRNLKDQYWATVTVDVNRKRNPVKREDWPPDEEVTF